jgi:CHAT domain-containing protein
LHLLRSDVGKVAWDLSGTRLEDLIHKINEAPEIKGQSKAGGPVSSNKIRAFYDWARQTGHPYLELVALRVLAQSLAAEGQWKSGIVYTIQAQDLRQRLVARIPLRQRLMEAGRLDYRLLLKAGLKNEPVVSTDYSSMAAQIVSFSEAILPPFAARAHLEQSDLKRVKDLLSNVTELSATVDRRRLDALDLLARGRRVESARQLDLFFQDLAKLLEGLRQLAPITATKTADAGGRESRSIYSGNILAYVNGLDKAVILSHEETLAAAVDTLAGTIEKAGGETSAEGFLPITLGGIGIGAQIRATRTALSDSGKDWVRRVASTVSAISDAIDRPISLRGTRMGHVIATLAASGVQEGLTVRLLGGTPEELAGHDSALFRGIYATQIALSLGKGGGFLELPGWRTASDMVASFKRMPQAAKWAKTLACLHAMNWLQSLRSLAVKEMRTRPELRRSIEIFTWYAMESWEEGGDDWDDDEKVNNESILKEFGFGTWASKYPALLLMLAGDRKQADSLATLMQSAQGDLDRASESTRLPSPLVDEGPDLFTARREIAFNLAIYFMAVSQYTDATQQLRRLVDSGQGGDGIDVYQYHYALALCYRRLNNPDAELLSLAAAVSGAQRLRQSMPIGNLAFRATDVRRLLTEEYLGLLYRRGQAREMEAVIWRYRRPARAPAALFRSQRDKEVPDLAALKDLYGALSTDAESPVTAADIRSVLARLAMGLVETANPGSLHFGGRPGEADASDTGLKPGDPSLNGIELAASALIDEISFSRPASDRLSITGPPRGRPVVEKDELLISYFVGMQGVFFVTTDGKGITRPYYRRVDYSQLEELCDKFRKGLAAERSTEETAGKIYELMLGRVPELNDTRKLRIIADGPLQLIPFQALRPSRTAPYLIERFNVEYVSGAPEPPISTNERRQARSVLVVANPGGDLKYSEGEARAIEDASGAPGPPALIGPKATIENVRRSLTEVGTVHFATHAQRNANQPNFSFLTLAGHDRIYSIDFEVLDLRGKRVFLAGCETLLAEAAFGDDVYGLADAVMGAGSSSVVATLWDVEDEASAKFASVFYKTLRDGGTDTEALAATERYFISGQAGPRLASPKFWAGFNHLTPLPFMAAP